MLTRRTWALAALVTVTALTGTAQAAPFTAGDLVVVRVGDGSGLHAQSSGDPVFLDEYTTDGQLVQSIELPSATSGDEHALLLSGAGLVGTGGSEGQLTRSADNRFLTLAGYGRDLGGTGSLAQTSPADVPRVIARIAAGGAVDTTTALSDFGSSTGGTPRDVATDDGSTFWVTGAINGGGAAAIRYAALRATTSTPISEAITTANGLRGVSLAGGQLFVSSASTSPQIRLGAVGSGLPSSDGQPIASVASAIDSTATTPNAFVFLDLNPAVPGVDTLYVADEDSLSSNTDGEIRKYTFDGTQWSAEGTAAATDVRGVVASVSGTTVTLYGSTGGGTTTCPGGVCTMPPNGGGAIYKLVDAGGPAGILTGAAQIIASPSAETGFRGIAWAPDGAGSAPPPGCTPTSARTAYQTAVTLTIACADPSDAALIRRVVSGPTEGTLGAFNDASGTVTYTPKQGAIGQDAFTVAARNGAGFESVPVTITVTIAPPTWPGGGASHPGSPMALVLARVHLSGPRLRLTAACAGTALTRCAGQLTFALAKPVKRIRTLGTLTYRLAAGATKTLTLMIPARARHVLAGRRVALRITGWLAEGDGRHQAEKLAASIRFASARARRKAHR